MKSLHRRFTQRSFHTQKLLRKEVFTQSGFYIQKLLHTKAFTERSLCTEAPLHEVTSWNWQQFFGKNPCHELFSKNIRNIFLKQVPIQSFQAHTAMKWRVEKSGGADEGRQPLNKSIRYSPARIRRMHMPVVTQWFQACTPAGNRWVLKKGLLQELGWAKTHNNLLSTWVEQ